MNIPKNVLRGGGGRMTKHVFILKNEIYLNFYVGECLMFQKYW
jgi:hypothetical protein